MTAYVYVSLKKSVLDPQGKTIQGALKKMGYKGLEGVRQGKYFGDSNGPAQCGGFCSQMPDERSHRGGDRRHADPRGILQQGRHVLVMGEQFGNGGIK